jgi:hypothetical protein
MALEILDLALMLLRRFFGGTRSSFGPGAAGGIRLRHFMRRTSCGGYFS